MFTEIYNNINKEKLMLVLKCLNKEKSTYDTGAYT